MIGSCNVVKSISTNLKNCQQKSEKKTPETLPRRTYFKIPAVANERIEALKPRHHKFKTTTFQDRHTCIRHQVQDINTSGFRVFMFWFVICLLHVFCCGNVLVQQGLRKIFKSIYSSFTPHQIDRINLRFPWKLEWLESLDHWISLWLKVPTWLRFGRMSAFCNHNDLVSVIILIWEEFTTKMNHQLMVYKCKVAGHFSKQNCILWRAISAGLIQSAVQEVLKRVHLETVSNQRTSKWRYNLCPQRVLHPPKVTQWFARCGLL